MRVELQRCLGVRRRQGRARRACVIRRTGSSKAAAGRHATVSATGGRGPIGNG